MITKDNLRDLECWSYLITLRAYRLKANKERMSPAELSQWIRKEKAPSCDPEFTKFAVSDFGKLAMDLPDKAHKRPESLTDEERQVIDASNRGKERARKTFEKEELYVSTR